LSDETGNRRWLPIEVAGHETPAAVGLAVAAVAAERDQLWAEAAVLFRLGGVAWCDAEALAKPEHARFEIVEPWAAAIGQWLEADAMDGADGPKRGDAPFTTEQVLIGAARDQRRATQAGRRRVAPSRLRRSPLESGWPSLDLLGSTVSPCHPCHPVPPDSYISLFDTYIEGQQG
jgi:predicted P-loop ATPase